MKISNFVIKENIPIASGVYKMILEGDVSEIKRPGQFVNIKIDGLFLRRPISVCNVHNSCLTLIYKVVGTGTEILKSNGPGEVLELMTGLGNGYDVSECGCNPVLIGGGVGVPPLYYLAAKLIEKGVSVTAILGFNKKDEVFCEKEFNELGVRTFVATVDGSYGEKGFVTDVLKNIDYSYFYTCGPEPMLKAVYKTSRTDGQFSFEKRMGCGFGACMGCSCKTLTGYKRICKEGPVLKKGEILWED